MIRNKANLEAQRDEANASAVSKYRADIASFIKRRSENLVKADEPVPSVPMAWEVATFTDPTEDKAVWNYLRRSSVPVCDPLPIPPVFVQAPNPGGALAGNRPDVAAILEAMPMHGNYSSPSGKVFIRVT